MSTPALEGRREAVDAAAAAIMVGLTFAWGFNQVAIKLASAGFSPLFMSAARSGIGALAVWLWCLLRGIPLFRQDGSLAPGLLVGFVFWAEFLMLFYGLDFTSAGRGALMLNTMPFWVLVGAHFVLGETVRPRQFAGLAMAFCGVVLVFSDRFSAVGSHALLGDALCLAAGAAWALNTLLVKRSNLAAVGAEKLVLYQLVVSAVLTLPVIPLGGAPLRAVTPGAVGALLFQAVFVAAFTYLVWFWLMRRYPAAGLSSFAFLSPVFAVLCGAALLGEPLTPRIFAALALIAAGLAVVNRPPRRRNTGPL